MLPVISIITPTTGKLSLYDLMASIEIQEVPYVHIMLWDDKREGDFLYPDPQTLKVKDPYSFKNLSRYSIVIPSSFVQGSACGSSLRAIGLMAANTPYVTFADDDVWYEKDHLKSLLAAVKDREWAYPVDPLTPVLCDGFRWKPIRDINIGDKIIGFDEEPINRNGRCQKRKLRLSVVESKIHKLLPAYRIMFEDGNSVITTGDHEWLVNSHRSSGSQWKRTDDINTGEHIYKPFDYVENPSIDNEDYIKGYIAGCWDGDGCISKSTKWDSYYIAITVCDKQLIDRVAYYFDKLSLPYVITHRHESRKYKNRRDAISLRLRCRFRDAFFTIYGGRGEIVKNPTVNYCRGYMAGIYDAEGSFDGRTIDIYQIESKSVINKIRKYSKAIGFNMRFDGRRFRLSGLIRTQRFFMMTLPAISRKVHINGVNNSPDGLCLCLRKSKVVKVVKMRSKRKMICLTTNTATFIANGYASHNCKRKVWRKTENGIQYIGVDEFESVGDSVNRKVPYEMVDNNCMIFSRRFGTSGSVLYRETQNYNDDRQFYAFLKQHAGESGKTNMATVNQVCPRRLEKMFMELCTKENANANIK